METYFRAMQIKTINESAYKFRELLDSEPQEQAVQEFLESHAFFLIFGPYLWHEFSITQPCLGSQLKPDFALFGRGNVADWWTFVELERPSDTIFNKSGDPSSKLVHALRQTRDWRSWLKDNRDYFRRTFGIYESWVKTAVVIGRRDSLSNSDRRQLQQMNAEDNRGNWIITYDGLLDSIRAFQKFRENKWGK